MDTLKERLVHAMESAGLSNRQTSKRAGLSSGAISRWLGRNASPSADTLADVARVLKVSPEWLAYGDGEMRGRPREQPIVLPTFPEDSATLQPLGDEDATIQVTVLGDDREYGLLTVRAKDQDLSADQFEALGLACLAAAKRIRGA